MAGQTRMSRSLYAFLALLIAISAISAASYWWQIRRFQVTTNNAYVHGDITHVYSRLDGHIANTRVGDNQFVEAGELLAKLDEREFAAKLALAQARLERSMVHLNIIEARNTLQQSLIRKAEAEIVSRQADIEGIDQKLTRLRTLREHDYAAVDLLDEQEINQKSAAAELYKAEAQLAAEIDQLAVLESEKKAMDVRIKEDAASVSLAQIELENTAILAPVSGVVGKRGLRLGQYVQAGTPLLSIVPREDFWIEANFKETQVENIRTGQVALLKFDAFRGQEIEARVHSLAPATGARFSLLPPENATGNFTKVVQRVPVRITLPETHPLKQRLVPGMSVIVTVKTRD
jgi:membrane fusion protein (multidrug efflux system)